MRDAGSCRTIADVRIALAALLLSGCAASEHRMQTPPSHAPVMHSAHCTCRKHPGPWPESPLGAVYGIPADASMVARLELRWGTPLETTLPAVVFLPADEAAFSAKLAAAEPAVLAALRIEIDREYQRHVEEVERARALWLDSLAGRNVTPEIEAKFLLDGAIDAALEDEAALVADRGAALFVAETSEYVFFATLDRDTELVTEGTLVEPISVRDISRARLARAKKKLCEGLARVRSREIATRMMERAKMRWAWARKKP